MALSSTGCGRRTRGAVGVTPTRRCPLSVIGGPNKCVLLVPQTHLSPLCPAHLMCSFAQVANQRHTFIEVSRCVFPQMRPSCPADTQVSFELPPMRPSCLADTHVTLMSRTFDVFVRTGRKSVTYVLEVSRRVFPQMRPSCPADIHVSLLSRTFDVIVRTCRRSVT